MKKLTASEAMLEVLLQWGVKRVFGLPGDSIDTTIDALHNYEDRIQFVQIRHEEVGGMAAGYEAELTGGIGVCLSIGGPGAIHMLNGLYDAKMNHQPVLALVGQVNSTLLNTEFFQEVDTFSLCQDVAVYNKLVESPESLPKLADEAIRTAIKERGVAVLVIPDDIGAMEITMPELTAAGPEIFSRPAIRPESIEKVAEMLRQSKRPIVLSGRGARDARPELKAFIEANHIPIIQTLPSKGNVADDHPNSLGNVGKLGTKPAYEAMKEADLLLMIGTNYPFEPYFPKPGTKAVQIDRNPSKLGKRFPVDVAIEGDVKDFLTALNAKGSLRSCDAFLRACQETMKHWNSWMEEQRNRRGDQIHPAFLMKQVEALAKPGAIFAIDVGTSTAWSARYLHVQPTQDLLISAWLGTMGCALPAAIGAKASCPDRQVISVAGDGALAMVMQDLVTAKKYDLPIVQFVLNNQKLAFIEYEQQSAGQRNYEIDLHDIDFAKVAEACGCDGYTVRTPEELEALMPKLSDVTVPTLVQVYVADDAPLPGQIVADEAEGYAKFVYKSIVKDHTIPKLPPLKEVLRQFF